MIPVGITCVLDEEQGVARLGQDYIQAVEKAGGIPVPIVTADEKLFTRLLDMVKALVLSGGGDLDPCFFGEEPCAGLGAISPRRDRQEIRLASLALERDLPVLGICRGAQVLNVAAGGTLYQDLASGRGPGLEHVQKAPRPHPFHSIKVEDRTLLKKALGGLASLKVNSFHHQAVKTPARGVKISALSPDGVIEGLEFPDHSFALGVQWHPENLARVGERGGQELFDALLQVAAKSQ